MARAARRRRSGPGYASLIIFIVLCLLLIAGYIPLGMSFAKRIDSLNALHRDIKENLENELGGPLRISAKPRPSSADVAYDASFFRTIADKAKEGLKYEEFLKVTGWEGEDPGKAMMEEFGIQEGKTLREYILDQGRDLSDTKISRDNYKRGMEDANKAHENIRSLLNEANERLAAERAAHTSALKTANEQYKRNVAQYKAQWLKANVQQKDWSKRYQTARASHKRTAAEIQKQIKDLNEVMAELRAELAKKKPKPVKVTQGTVLRCDAVEGIAIINMGKREKIVKGERFTVVRPVRGGKYVPKGVIQVVRVEPLISRADILTQDEDHIIMRGDIVWRQKKVEPAEN